MKHVQARTSTPFVLSSKLALCGLLAANTLACGAAQEAEDEGITTLDLSAPGSELTEEEAQDIDGEVRQIEQKVSASACATATANQTFTGGIAGGHISPRSYNTCTKGYVVDLNNITSPFVGQGVGGGNDAAIRVEYADTSITTKSQCENTLFRTILYTNRLGVNNWDTASGVYDTGSTYGKWVAQPINNYACELGINVTGMSEGDDYRFAITSRDDGVTRKVKIITYPFIIIN